MERGELFGIELIESETEAKVVVGDGNELLVGDDGLIDDGLELGNEDSHRVAHEFLDIVEMQLMVPTWRCQIKHFINELEQVDNSIGLNILVVIIHKDVMFFFLLHNAQNDVLEVGPGQSDIYLAELFHSVHELDVGDVALDD